MDAGFNLPQKAFINKFIAKSKFYEKAAVSAKLQKEFVDKIQKITWQYKLAEETIGITKTDRVTEIQIFEIELREKDIPRNILKVIDKAIPYPILYRFIAGESFAYGITLKENNKPSNYYFSEWNEHVAFDFTAIDLEKVYQKLIKTFLPVTYGKIDDFNHAISHDLAIKTLAKEINTLENKISKEKQFNRKVEINKVLLEKKEQFEKLLEVNN